MSCRICRNYGGNVTKELFTLKNVEEIETDPYASFSQYNSKLPNVSCRTGEPDFISILMGTITLSELFNLLVLDQVLDNMNKGIENG